MQPDLLDIATVAAHLSRSRLHVYELGGPPRLIGSCSVLGAVNGDRGPTIAPGEVILASRDSPLYAVAHLRLHYNDAVAVEMEGAWLVQAAHLNADLPALVIRGINATGSSPDRSAAHNWASAVSVCATKPPLHRRL